MAAYVVFLREETTDPEELHRYRELASRARDGHDLTPVAYYGDLEVLEGPSFEGAVILRFPDADAARAWYRSPAYQDAMRHRVAGSRSRAFLIEGVPDATSTHPSQSPSRS
ncbi:MAG: DUF1330 domain-containing protein [Telmatospirillum sp.]|nr:DUF1330 domain-containing protein [Telmatospirillum sp.]